MTVKDKWENSYQKFASAIVVQAAKDYRAVIKRLNMNPYDKELTDKAIQIEMFFRSEWYQALTSIDGEYLIKRLRKEASESN